MKYNNTVVTSQIGYTNTVITSQIGYNTNSDDVTDRTYKYSGDVTDRIYANTLTVVMSHIMYMLKLIYHCTYSQTQGNILKSTTCKKLIY